MVIVKHEVVDTYASIYEFKTFWPNTEEVIRRKFGASIEEIMNGDAGLDLTDRELIEAVLEEEPNKYILYFDECEDAFILIEIKD